MSETVVPFSIPAPTGGATFGVTQVNFPQADKPGRLELVVIENGPAWLIKGGRDAGGAGQQLIGQGDYDLAATLQTRGLITIEPSLGIVTVLAKAATTGYLRFDFKPTLEAALDKLVQTSEALRIASEAPFHHEQLRRIGEGVEHLGTLLRDPARHAQASGVESPLHYPAPGLPQGAEHLRG